MSATPRCNMQSEFRVTRHYVQPIEPWSKWSQDMIVLKIEQGYADKSVCSWQRCTCAPRLSVHFSARNRLDSLLQPVQILGLYKCVCFHPTYSTPTIIRAHHPQEWVVKKANWLFPHCQNPNIDLKLQRAKDIMPYVLQHFYGKKTSNKHFWELFSK